MEFIINYVENLALGGELSSISDWLGLYKWVFSLLLHKILLAVRKQILENQKLETSYIFYA